MKTNQTEKTNKKTCCLCGAKIKGHGNNPWPLADKGECCDACNAAVVAERMRREAKPAPKTNVLSRVYDALLGVASERGAEFFDAFYAGGGAKMLADVQAVVEKRNSYARAYYQAHREKLAEASRLCHAKRRAALKAAKLEAAKKPVKKASKKAAKKGAK